MTTLRPYQEELLAGISQSWRSGKRRVLGQLPTGGGKGRILAAAAARTSKRGKRIILMAHRAELVEQICANLDDEDIPHGRIMPGWPMMRYPVQVGMVQTIVRRLDRLDIPDLLLIDECHHAEAGQYKAIAECWASAHVLGVSATPARTDGKGLSDHFDEMILGPSVGGLIQAGHLANYDYYLPSADFSMDGIGKQAGDYNVADTLKIIEKSKIVGDAVQHYRRFLDGQPAIAFCMGIQHCQDTAAEFRAAGIRSAHVDGKMPMALRKERLSGLANGTLDVLTAADVISEGVDIPAVAGAILLRPTCSLVLHLQQVGRALRPKTDGRKAVILDHVGNATRHGLPADPRRWTLDGAGKKEAPAIRECESCHRVFAAGTAREIAEQECGIEDCPMLAPAGGGERAPLAVAPGTLEIVKDPWSWAKGCDPVRASGAELRALIDLADTEDRLRMIARARGYKRGWSQHQLRLRAERGIAA